MYKPQRRWPHAAMRRAVAGAGALFFTASVFAQALVVGFFDVPPHVTQDKAGRAVGPAVELFQAVAQRMGLTDIRYLALPLSRALLSLERGEIDAILFISKNPEREAKFFYPATPYYLSKPSLAVTHKSALHDITRADDLKTITIGTFLGMNLSPTLRQPGVTLDTLAGADAYYARNFQKLMMGRIDAVYSPDELALAQEIKANHLEPSIRIVSLPDAPNATYAAFNRKHANTLGPHQYQAALEAVLKERGGYIKGFVK